MNPILEMTGDRTDPVPLVELKQHLVFFVKDPPGPRSARLVYDAYLSYCGDVFTKYRSTYPSAPLKDWTPGERQRFEQSLLPALRTKTDWGYGFTDGKPVDSWLFMFHGFRPFQQPHMASFYRFEFDWQVKPSFLRQFADIFIHMIPFLSGYGGYFFQVRPASKYGVASYDRMFALAMRYWGCEATDIEQTAAQMKKGYKCVNWITMIGEPFYAEFKTQIDEAKSVAYAHSESPFGTLIQAAERPLIGDRNRLANLDGYFQIAKALLPIQITEHSAFGGNRWTDENTLAWLRRFTHAMP